MGEDCGIRKAMLDSDMVKMPPVERMTPLGFLRFSSEYLRAATIIHQKDPTLITPVYFLACHSIELAMKAYLLARGQKLAHLKNALRHDLEALHKLAITQSPPEFPSSPELVAILKLVGAYYKEKQFEYIEVGFKTLPTIDDLLTQASRTVSGVGSALNLRTRTSGDC